MVSGPSTRTKRGTGGRDARLRARRLSEGVVPPSRCLPIQRLGGCFRPFFRLGEVVRSGEDGPAKRITSRTRRIVITTARATPVNAPRTVCTPLMGCSRRVTTLGGDRSATGTRQPRRIRTRSMDSSPHGVTDVSRQARGDSQRARSQQERSGGPRSARTGSERRVLATIGGGRELVGVGADVAGECGVRRGGQRVSARRLSIDSSPAPVSSAASGAGDAAATVAAPPARPAIATITARSAANHRDRPRPTSSATARRHLLDSSAGGGSRGHRTSGQRR